MPAPLIDTARARVLVVGDVMLDRYWFGDVSRISPEAPVPVVKVERTEDRPGGAANVARNCAALGARTGLLSVVGADEAGQALAKLLAAADIDASLHEDAQLNTTVKLRVLGSSNCCASISRTRRITKCSKPSWPSSANAWPSATWSSSLTTARVA